MFERFSQEARDAVVRADHEAADMGAGYIGCEHLLLGLLAMPGPAAGALTAAGLDLAGLRARLPGTAPGAADPLDAEALAWLGIDLDAVRRAGHSRRGGCSNDLFPDGADPLAALAALPAKRPLHSPPIASGRQAGRSGLNCAG